MTWQSERPLIQMNDNLIKKLTAKKIKFLNELQKIRRRIFYKLTFIKINTDKKMNEHKKEHKRVQVNKIKGFFIFKRAIRSRRGKMYDKCSWHRSIYFSFYFKWLWQFVHTFYSKMLGKSWNNLITKSVIRTRKVKPN